MTRKDKELLLKDLCKRLPYGVYVEHTTSGFFGKLHDISVYQRYNDDDTIKDYECYTNFFGDETCKIEFFKPYLFPISSMNDIQKEIYKTYKESLKDEKYFIESLTSLNHWLYSNHFDVNKLIEKGLAIDASNLNIY